MTKFGGSSLLLLAIGFITLLTIVPAEVSSSKPALFINLSEDIHCHNYYNPYQLRSVYSEGIGGTGIINFTNLLEETTLEQINITFNRGTTTGWTAGGETGINIIESPTEIRVLIPRLGPGESKTVSYEIAPDTVKPLEFEVTQTPEKILVGQNTNVTFTVIRNESLDPAIPVSSLRFTIMPVDTNSNGVPDWSLRSPSTDQGSAALTDRGIVWEGFEVSASSPQARLEYIATENDPVAHNVLGARNYSMTLTDIECTLQNSERSHTNVYIIGRPMVVTTDVKISLEKTRLTDNSSGNGDWGFTPSVTNVNPEGVDFVLNSITVWITDSVDLNNPINTTSYGQGPVYLLSGSTWRGDMIRLVNFSTPYSNIPVGWLRASFYLTDNPGVVQGFASGGGSEYLLFTDTIVVNGYFVEVKKTVSRNTTNMLDVSLRIFNNGTADTPENVIIFDIIPSTFEMQYASRQYDGLNAVAEPVTGYAYWWNLGKLAKNDNSPGGGDEVLIDYTIQGNGAYNNYDAFLIGVDPANTYNLHTSEKIESRSMMISLNTEFIIAMVVVLLIVTGIFLRLKR